MTAPGRPDHDGAGAADEELSWTERHDRASKAAPGISDLLGLGAAFGACVAVGIFLGVLLDHVTGDAPLFELLGTALGIVVGAWAAYQVIRPYLKG